jgi:hypothetical protein
MADRRRNTAALPPPLYAPPQELDGLLTARVLEALQRLQRGQPVRLTVVAAAGAVRDEVQAALHAHPLWRVEERAPLIYDVELPNTKFEVLMQSAKLFRKVDLGGRIFGVRVPGPEDRAVVRIALELPLTAQERRDLRGMGLLITREGEGDVSGETLGRSLAAFVAADWLGPVEVRRVALGGAER